MNNDQTIEEFSDYEQADSYFKIHVDEYQNLLISDGERIIAMEYGLVEFKNDNACSINTEYYSLSKDSKDYLNSCYGADGAYLETDDSGERIYFMISGDRGYASIDDVILHPYESLEVKPSLYENKDGNFSHKIKTQLDQDYYSYSLNLDNNLEYLENNKEYFSYDGHYFYDDFYIMIDDYRNNSYENAVNTEAYYNYFQYLPYRSISSYSYEELNKYFSEDLSMTGRVNRYRDYDNDLASDEINRSELYDQMDSFIVYQYMYGSNAMMLLSSAINESSYGRSYNSYFNNNLYAAAAYESEKEKQNSRYDSIDNSIYSFAKYFISSMFSNHMRSDYRGTFFGNKLSGINVNYSLDPYFGEKNSSLYFELDKKLGGKDLNSYSIGIIKDKYKVNFYEDENLESRRFTVNDISELAYVILSENEDSYKIQVDSSFNDEYLYDFEKSVAYVSKDVFDIVLNSDKIHENEYRNVHYDFDGGTFHDYGNLDIKTTDDILLPIEPFKHGFEFVSYDNQIAQYLQIDKVELIGKKDLKQELYQSIDLDDLKLKVYYDDNQTKTIEVNSDMLGAYDNTIEGKQIINISYAGFDNEIEVDFSQELSELRNRMNEALENKDYDFIKDNIKKIYYPLTFSEIRTIDYELMQKNKRNYVIKDNTGDNRFSISGLDLSLDDKKSFSFVEDTYYIEVEEITPEDKQKILSVASGYDFDGVEGIDISFRFNYQKIDLNGPVIVQIPIEDKKNNLVYSVYHLDENDDVVKCRTTQSDNYIQFLISESGAYEILSMPSVNEYDIEDQTEDLSYENMGYDNHRINFNLMFVSVLALAGIIGIIVYYIYYGQRKKLWRDFRKSLQTAGYAQEEKPKN